MINAKVTLKIGLPPSKSICFISFNKSPLYLKKKCFLLHLFVLEILNFLSWVLDHVEKTAWLKNKVKFKIYDVTTWLINNYNRDMPNILWNKCKTMKSGQLIEKNKRNIFLPKSCRKCDRDTRPRPCFIF